MNVKTKITESLLREAEAPKANLSSQERQKVNATLTSKMKNKYYPGRDDGLSVLSSALKDVDCRYDGGGLYITGDSGRVTIDITRMPHHEDPFMPPVSIHNSMAVYSWHKMQTGKFEITIYLS